MPATQPASVQRGEKSTRTTTPEQAVERMEKTRPTPSQEENDKAAMGEHVEHHADDGSPEEGPLVASADPEKQKAERAKVQAEATKRMEESRPTPTQEENDRTASGEHLESHEPDGTPEQDAGAVDKKEKDAKAKPTGATYETRSVKAKKPESAEHKPAEH